MWGADANGVFRAMQGAWNHAPFASLELSMAKEAIGWAVGTGLTAAILAENGWLTTSDGGTDPSASAFFPATPFDEPEASRQPFVTSLGQKFEIENNYFKRHAACRYTHTAIDELRAVLGEGISPGDVEGVEVATHTWATFLDRPRPVSLEHAQYSYQFVLGSVLARGSAGPLEIADDRLADPEVVAMSDRIHVTHDPRLDVNLPGSYPTRLTVTLKSGQVLERPARLVATGDAASPMTDEELREKAIAVIDIAMPGGSAEILASLSDSRGTAAFWRRFEVLTS
jgi:2-methylcitrate dehydratase PrpD